MSIRDSLKPFSTDDLLAEILRRRNAHEKRIPNRWCDDCRNFIPSPTADEKYNPCGLGHSMSFFVPGAHDSPDVFGYYRRVCPDRSDK